MRRWITKQWYRLCMHFFALYHFERVQEVQWEVNGRDAGWEIGLETDDGFARFYSLPGRQSDDPS